MSDEGVVDFRRAAPPERDWRLIIGGVVALVVVAGVSAMAGRACAPGPTIEPTPSEEPSPSATPEPTATPTPTPTPTPSAAPTPPPDRWSEALRSWQTAHQYRWEGLENPRPDGGNRGAAESHWDAVCATCHGLTGGGDGRVADRIDPVPGDLRLSSRHQQMTDGARFLLIKEGVPGTMMGGFGDALSDDAIWDLVHLIGRRVEGGTGGGAGDESKPDEE